MIKEQAISCAVGASIDYATRGLRLIPKQHTPLDNLVGLSLPGLPDLKSLNDDTFVNVLKAGLVTYTNSGDVDSPTSHDRYSDSLIKDLAEHVKRHISFARNVVKPKVIEFHEQLALYMQNYTVPPASEQFEIEAADLPNVLKDQSFINEIEYAVGGKSPMPTDFISFGPSTDKEILTTIMTGDRAVDEAILDTFANKPHGFLMNIWDNVFNNGTNQEFYSINSKNVFTKAEIYLAIYLIARKLVVDIRSDIKMPSNAKGLTGNALNNYKTLVNEIKDYAAACINDAIKKIDFFAKSNTLVVVSDEKAKYIKVYKPLYDQWLSEGGKPEILLGMLISGRTTSLLSVIKESSDKMLSDWTNFEKFSKVSEENKAFADFKSALMNIYFSSTRERDQNETTYITSHPNYYDQERKAVEAYVDSLKISCMKDVRDVSLHMVAKCRFLYTDSYNILKEMEVSMEMNDKLDVREAALISCINYLSSYFASQIQVMP